MTDNPFLKYVGQAPGGAPRSAAGDNPFLKHVKQAPGSATRDLGRMAVQGLTFGFGDEIAGLMGAATGGSYTEARDASRARLERVRAERPIASTVAEIAGGAVVPVGTIAGVLRGGVAGARGVQAARAAGAARAAPTIGQAAKSAAKVGGATGALYGVGEAGSTEGEIAGVGEMAGGAAIGGGLGAGLGAALGAGAGALGQRAARRAAGRTAQESDNLAARKLAEKQLTPEQPTPGVQSPPAEGASDLLTEVGKQGMTGDMTDEGARILNNLRAAQVAGQPPVQPVTHAQQIAAARELVGDIIPDKLPKRMNAAQVLGTAQKITKDVDEMAVLADRVARGVDDAGNALTPEQMLADGARLANLSDEIGSASARLNQSGTEAGRDLNIFRLLSRRGPPQENPAAWITQAARVKGSELSAEQLGDLTRLINAGDPKELYSFINGLRPSTNTEKAVQWFRAMLLNNPAPHLANTSGNTTWAVLREAADLPAVVLDRIIGATLTGNISKAAPSAVKYTAQARSMQEASRSAAEMLGFKGAYQAFRSGEGPRSAIREFAKAMRKNNVDDLAKWDVHRDVNFDNAFADVVTKLPFKALSAQDEVFRAPARVASLYDQAASVAYREGHRGQALKTRIAEIAASPTDAMAMQAEIDAVQAVFMEKGNVAKAINAVRNAFGEPGKVVMPFTTFASNVFERSITELSPVGMARGMNRVLKLALKRVPEELVPAEQRKAVELISRSGLANAPIALGAYLASKGLMTGPASTGADRAEHQLAGSRANAVRIGDRWYGVDRFAPVGNQMMMGAALYEALSSPDRQGADALIGAAAAAATTAQELSPFQGFRNVSNIANDPAGAGGQVLSNIVGSAVAPPLVARAARAMDDRERATDGFTDRLQARVPGLRGRLPERVDALGTTVPAQGGPGAFGIFGPTTDRTAGDPLRQELVRVGANIRPPARRKGESMEEYQARARAFGRQAQVDLMKMMTQGRTAREYARATDEEKAEMIRRTLSASRSRLTRAANR